MRPQPRQAGVRLITVDRPGYGRSDRVTQPTLTGFAHDLERLLDHLWVGQIRVVGWLGGGQYAAACAAVLADRVSDVGLVATPAPDNQVPWLPPPFREVVELVNDDFDQGLAAAATLGASLAPGSERARDASVSPFDGITQMQPEVRQAFWTMWAEAFRAGAEGLAADMVAASRPWGFATAQVRARAVLFYDAHDPVIGPAHGQWWAGALPRARLNLRPAGAQLGLFGAWSDILQAVAASPKREGRQWR